MPTYEYRCPDGHTFEVFQNISDDPTASCPECGKDAARQISGGAGFLFKGEGFYATDYRSPEYRKKAKAEKDGSSKTEATSKGGESSAGDVGSDSGAAGAGGTGGES